MLYRVEAGEDESIVATGGHQFWKSGHGWIKGRDLLQGDLVHTSQGNVSIRFVTEGPTLPTYNLVVADFHTYFVGKSGMLVQDLLPPEPTNMIVPGLTKFGLVALEDDN